MIAALALRLYGLDWDRGYYLHPDELHVADVATSRISLDWPPDWGNLLNPEKSHYNPRANDPNSGRPTNYAYGALPIIITSAAATIVTHFNHGAWDSYAKIYKVGRFLSALMDTITAGLVFLIARRIFSSHAALLASLIYALIPIGIQLSHFFTTDAWVATFVALTLYCSIRAGQSGRRGWFALAGFAFGLALATKGSVVPLGLPIAAAGVWSTIERFDARSDRLAGLVHLVELGLISFITAFVGFALFEPYAIARPRVYLAQLQEQSRIVRGTLDVPYTRQYVGTLPFFYQAEQLVKWGAGPVAGLLCLGGIVYLFVTFARLRSVGMLVLLVWLVSQGLVVGLPQIKFVRYLAPLIPVLAIGAGATLASAVETLRRGRWRGFAPLAAAAVLAGAALWTAAFSNVYAHENPRIAASSWMYANIPNGSHLTAESWDLSMPVALMPGLTPDDAQYSIVNLDIYGDRDPNIVADYLYKQLQTANYVVMASNRVVTGIDQLPWRYPVQIRYYQMLNSGQLGFHKIADFRTDPGIGSFRINDQTADESLLNYDHPEVLIYKKSTLVDRPSYDALMATAVETPSSPTRSAQQKSLMLNQPDESLPVVNDGRWSSALTSNSVAALVVWIVLLLVLQLIGAPIAAILFDRFGDLGWGLSRLMTLLLAGYLVWIAASVKLIEFTAIWSWIAIAVVAIGSFALARRTSFGARLRRRRAIALGAEITFWAVFAFFLLLRWANPDSWHPEWGGEKPMEFAHFNAILRSAHFPPYDPWFSGGFINYYYYGEYLVAFCFKLTGIPSEIAFNLAQPTFIALLASAAYSVAATLGRSRTERTGSRLAGWLGALLMVGIGNLSTLVHIAHVGLGNVRPNFYDWTWAPSRAIAGGITEFPYFTALYADLHAHVVAWPLTVLVIALCYALAADPRLIVAAGTESAFRRPARMMLGARLLLLALTLGSLAATNAWDVAVYGALFAVAVFMATRLLDWLILRLAITAGIVGVTGGVAYGLFLPFFTQYVALFGSVQRVKSHTSIGDFTTHIGIFLGIIGIGAIFTAVQRGPRRLFYVMRDPIVGLASIGGLLFLTLTGRQLGEISSHAAGIIVVAIVAAAFVLLLSPSFGPGASRRDRLSAAAPLAGVLAGLALGLLSGPTLGLAICFASLGVFLWLTAVRSEIRMTGALIAAGSFVAAGVDVVFLVDDLAGDPYWYRMNSVFKFYNQIWTLLAIASAVMLAGMLRAALAPSEAATTPAAFPIVAAEVEDRTEGAEDGAEDGVEAAGGDGWSIRGWGLAGSAIGVALILAGLLYPLLATLPRLDQRFPGHRTFNTLNALDWMRYGTIPGYNGTIAFADDLKAINWFNDNVAGSPVIAEASIGAYRGNGSRFSIATGLPDVIGWDHHETQQRYPDGIAERMQDVRTLYDSADINAKRDILLKYNVRYVIVGDIERDANYGGSLYASAEGIAAFKQMIGATLQVAFTSGTTTVYRVIPAS